jgi:hypothetical protein
MQSDRSILQRANSLCNEACLTIALQHRRLRSIEPGDDNFVFRWWADIQFLIVALRRLRRSAEIAVSILKLSSLLNDALREFDDALPCLAKMRNVGEHVEDYALDRGRDRSVSRSEIQVGSWDGTVYSWLGESLNIDTALSAAQKLLMAVRKCFPLV